MNVVAMGLLSSAVARGLRAAGRTGVIVNFGSLQETLPVPGYGSYVTSKGAVTAATSALAVELAPLGVRVNSVAPGVVSHMMSVETDSGPARGPRSQRPQGPPHIGRRIRAARRPATGPPRLIPNGEGRLTTRTRLRGHEHSVRRTRLIPRPATPCWPPPRRTRQGRSGGTGSKPWPY